VNRNRKWSNCRANNHLIIKRFASSRPILNLESQIITHRCIVFTLERNYVWFFDEADFLEPYKVVYSHLFSRHALESRVSNRDSERSKPRTYVVSQRTIVRFSLFEYYTKRACRMYLSLADVLSFTSFCYRSTIENHNEQVTASENSPICPSPSK